MTQIRPSTVSSVGSTVVVEEQPSNCTVVAMTLKKKKNKTVRWEEGTIDNEFLNKKKSKKCCIYTPSRSFDDEYASDGSSCSDCDGECSKEKQSVS